MKFPRPDGVSMTNGMIVLGYEDHDERDLAFDWLDAFGAGEQITPQPIKHLVWNEYKNEDGEYEQSSAWTEFSTTYQIDTHSDGFSLKHEWQLLGVFEGFETAMAAAQHDYEKRLRSAYQNVETLGTENIE